jgi:hypothetical protein
MLDDRNAAAVNLQRWEQLERRTQLLCSWRKYVRDNGAARICADSRRRFERIPLRAPAILYVAGEFSAAYAKDVSRTGVGFLSPVNLLPRQSVELQLMDGKILRLRVTRCRRLGPACYECGTLFDLAKRTPAAGSASPHRSRNFA